MDAEIAKRAEGLLEAAFREDVGTGDVTTISVVSPGARATAVMRAREPLVLAGLALACRSFQRQDSSLILSDHKEDGIQAEPGSVLLRIQGRAQPILTAERVALNFVQRLSGIATLTARFVAAIQGTKAKILDTRKTLPGWRELEKYAVRCGGGTNHRFGLFDMVLIKDNHLAALGAETPDPVGEGVRRARKAYPQLKVEVEADTLAQVEAAVRAGADFILLDNMTPAQLKEAVGLVAGKAKTEASGGVTLSTVREIAESGVDFISIGALTHSPRAVDIGLDFEVLKS